MPGDTWQWAITLADYPPSDGWSLTYALRGAGTIDLEATALDALTFLVTANAWDTKPLPSGPYQFAAIATRIFSGTQRRATVRTGVIQVATDLAAAAAGAVISPAEQMLTQIQAVLQGRATADVESYQIAGRALTKIPMHELLALETIYAARVWRERHPRAAFPVRRTRFA